MLAVKQAGFGFAAVLLGVVGMDLILADLGPGETIAQRMLITGGFFFVSGLLFGVLNKRYWPGAALIAWGGVLAAIVGLIDPQTSIQTSMAVLSLTLGLALAGSFAGAWLAEVLVRRRKKA